MKTFWFEDEGLKGLGDRRGSLWPLGECRGMELRRKNKVFVIFLQAKKKTVSSILITSASRRHPAPNPSRHTLNSIHWRSHRPATPGGWPGFSSKYKRNLLYIYIKFYDFIVKYFYLIKIVRALEILWLRAHAQAWVPIAP